MKKQNLFIVFLTTLVWINAVLTVIYLFAWSMVFAAENWPYGFFGGLMLGGLIASITRTWGHYLNRNKKEGEDDG